MHKNIFRIFVLGFLIFTVGCSKSREPRLYFAVGGTPSGIALWEKIVSDFEAESNIKVELLRQPTDTDQRRQGLVIPLRAQRNDPDVFLMDVAWLAQFAASGWLEPLNSFITNENYDLNIFFEPILQSADRYQGALIALPVFIDGGLLYYRRDLLEQAGFTKPPKTWDELIEMSLAVQNQEQSKNPAFYGFVWQGAQYEGLICNFLEFAGSDRGGFQLRDGMIDVDSPQNRTALQMMQDLIWKEKISPPNTFTEMKEETVRSYFQNGNALFERNWPYAWSLHEAPDSPVKGKFGMAPLPHFKKGASVSTLGGWHIGISKFSDAKPEAWKFVRFILSPAVQKRLALELGLNPGRKDLYNDPDMVRQMPYLETLRDIFENAVSRPQVPYYTQISEALQKSLNGALARELTPGEALSRAQEEINRIVDHYQPVS